MGPTVPQIPALYGIDTRALTQRIRDKVIANGEGGDVDGRDGRLADQRRGDGVLAVAVVVGDVVFVSR